MAIIFLLQSTGFMMKFTHKRGVYRNDRAQQNNVEVGRQGSDAFERQGGGVETQPQVDKACYGGLQHGTSLHGLRSEAKL